MTIEEFKQKRDAIRADYLKRQKNLNEEFALSRNPVKLGDIISDHYHTIRVKAIAVEYNANADVPKCWYRGEQLTKKGTPAKYQAFTAITQINLRTINGVRYSYGREINK